MKFFKRRPPCPAAKGRTGLGCGPWQFQMVVTQVTPTAKTCDMHSHLPVAETVRILRATADQLEIDELNKAVLPW